MEPENQQPDYSFILNPEQPTKKGLLPGGGKKRWLIFGGGLLALLILLLVVISSLSGGGESISLGLVQKHTELIRISEIGEEKARGQAAKNLATTTRLTLQSSEPELLAIANNTQKVDKKMLAAGQKAATDKTLTEAEQRSQFDEVFTSLVSKELEDYRSELETAFNSSQSSRNKQLYSSLYNQLGDIIETASGAQN